MKMSNFIFKLAGVASAIILTASTAAAQGRSGYEPRFELGGGVGGSFYESKKVSTSRGSADAGFNTSIAASAWLGHDMYDKLGGEVHYDFAMNEMKLTSGSTKVTFGGRSHAIHYDVMFYGADRNAKVRPYFFAGGGFKHYLGTGTPTAFQGLNQVAVLTDTSDLKPMVTFGGGVKFHPQKNVAFRAEFRDNLSQFPVKVITPVDGSTPGWLHNFMVLFGIGFIF